MDTYRGTIIEESLTDTSILKGVKILSTSVEPVTPEHSTPHVKQWTMHTIEIPESEAAQFAEDLAKVLHDGFWYADFVNDTHHYIVFRKKIFFIERTNQKEYEWAQKYGISIGIPERQLDFMATL
jgi:hypothetical protein